MFKRSNIDNIQKVEVSDVLENFGKYQIMQYMYICFPMFLVAINNVNYIFVAGDVQYSVFRSFNRSELMLAWCNCAKGFPYTVTENDFYFTHLYNAVSSSHFYDNNILFVVSDTLDLFSKTNQTCLIPECDSINSNYTVPWWPNHTDHCTKPILNQSHLNHGVCSNRSFTVATEKCTDWIYENHDTIVPQLKLACQPWKKNMVGTIHSIGMAVAMITAGWVADIIGRKPTLLIYALGCVVGNFKTLASNYHTYISIEFVEAAMSGGVFTVGAVLMFEIAGNKNRVLAGVVFAYAIYMGEAMIAVIGMAIQHWKTLIYVICSPSIMFLCFIKLGNESPRWLIVKGKANQTKNILKDMAEVNNINIDEEEFNNIDEEKLKVVFNIGKSIKKQGIIQAFQCKELVLRFVIASFCRFTVSFIYYGLLVNSVVLPGDKYINFLLAAVMSFPGELISMFFINKFGRRLPLMIEYLLCGIACVASIFASETWLKTGLFLFGKLVTSACFTGVVTYTVELFPTSVRGSLIGLCTLSSALGNMLAPLTPGLSPMLVSSLFGCAALIASGLLYFTPETKGLPLLDTIEQVSDSIKDKSNKINCSCERLL